MRRKRKDKTASEKTDTVSADNSDGKVAVELAGDESITESVAEEKAEDTPAATDAVEEDWHDRYLRLVAEFDNFRKRTARQFESIVQSAESDLIAEITGVLDNLGRAADGDHKGESLDDFAKGVGLIRDQLWKTLSDRGLERMETVGQKFDPEAHDALMQIPSEEHDEGIIVQEIAAGFRLNGNVLRHAQVVVSQGNDKSDDESDSAKA